MTVRGARCVDRIQDLYRGSRPDPPAGGLAAPQLSRRRRRNSVEGVTTLRLSLRACPPSARRSPRAPGAGGAARPVAAPPGPPRGPRGARGADGAPPGPAAGGHLPRGPAGRRGARTTSPPPSATTRSSIVAGETGSGKTTQIPKICLELGRGIDGHDRPHPAPADRRPVGRRADRRGARRRARRRPSATRSASPTSSASDTLVKVMTDGILLAEMQRDRDLRRYDTIIIDEAHERSLNIDFILGYLKQLLPRRPDLKVDHHLGDDRPRSASPSTSPSRRHAGADHRGLRPHLPGRGPLPPARRPATARGRRARPGDRASCEAVEELWTERPERRHPRLPLGRARDP